LPFCISRLPAGSTLGAIWGLATVLDLLEPAETGRFVHGSIRGAGSSKAPCCRGFARPYRVSFESGGRGFEPLRARHSKPHLERPQRPMGIPRRMRLRRLSKPVNAFCIPAIMTRLSSSAALDRASLAVQVFRSPKPLDNRPICST